MSNKKNNSLLSEKVKEKVKDEKEKEKKEILSVDQQTLDHIKNIIREHYPEFLNKKIIKKGRLTSNRNIIHFHVKNSKTVILLDVTNNSHYLCKHPKSYKELTKILHHRKTIQ
jgi:hypothetical protein